MPAWNTNSMVIKQAELAAYHIHVFDSGREQLKNIFTHVPQSIIAYVISIG